MEDHSYPPMVRTSPKIIRKSIHTFLQNYHSFSTTASLLALPFSASLLLSQSLIPLSPLLAVVQNRLLLLLEAAGFPPSSPFFSILTLKLSQTITSSTLLLPLSLSSLLFAKSFVIQSLNPPKPVFRIPFFSCVSTFINVFETQVLNFLLIVSANATCFFLLFLAFGFRDALDLSSSSSTTTLLLLSVAGAILYSIVLANTIVICNLALVLAGIEKCGGFNAILKACLLIKGRASTALSLAMPLNMALAGVEALFQYRVLRGYSGLGKPDSSLALEGIFIAYLYSFIIVLDAIVWCVFYRSCKTAYWMEQEERFCYQIVIRGADGKSTFANVKTHLEEIP